MKPVYWAMDFGTPKEPIIGKNVTMSGYEPVFFDCQDQIIIGDDSFLGHGVKLLTGGHSYDRFGNDRQIALIHAPIIIGKGVWIGSFAIVLKGVSIGDHSVIGAGSVLTKSVPSYEVWVGNPAHCIKRYNQTTKKWERI